MKMTQADGAKLLRGLIFTLQRMRSAIFENMGNGLPKSLLPWVIGDICPLPALVRLVDTFERKGDLSPIDVYNMTLVATVMQPEIEIFYKINRKEGFDCPPLPKSTTDLLPWKVDE